MATDQLFDRRVRLTIGQEPPTDNFVQTVPDAAVITGLRISFRVEKSLKPEPQKATVVVYNLSSDSRAKLQGKGLRVVLEAGYPDSLAVIYSGHSRVTDHPRQGVNWLSKFECGTAERAIKFARMSESFKPGAAVGDVVKKTVAALVADPGNALEKANGLAASFSSGYAAHGYAADELTRLLEPHGYTWSIQDGRMQLLGPGETLPESPVDLSPSTGLIGSPELGSPVTKGGPNLVKMRSLLQPQFAPGKRVLLNSSGRSGVHKIISLAHVGDTDGGDWFTDLETLPV